MATTVLGGAAHDEAVAAVVRSYQRIPAEAPVRLAKQTSNLFRPRGRPAVGLDVSGLDDVIGIDVAARTADVQGMCSYERLVAATLAHGLLPLVVPQLKTITLGGAVTGLGVESSSLRNGLPHESVLEMDVLTGSGQIVTATAHNEHAELFYAFPNSYGSLGYALRLRIRLEPVSPFVSLQHVRFSSLDELSAAVERIAETGQWHGDTVDFVDGVMFSLSESYLTLATWAEQGQPSDYTGQDIYYRSIKARESDCLTTSDYIWRWDTDWFWCSAAFGAQRPLIRRLWPKRYRRSDVYHRIIGWENRHGLAARVDGWRGRPARERVVQDVEVPLERTANFLRWFAGNVAMSPVWLCPLTTHQRWPLYPLEPGHVYVNIGFWGTVPVQAGSHDGDVNRSIEQAVAEFGGHKSLYSDVYYDTSAFDAMYGGEAYAAVRDSYDPEHRLTSMYEKVVGRQ